MKISVPSFAKINWYLKVLGKRSDGFHEVQTVLQTIDLADRLEFAPEEGSEVRLQVWGREVSAGEENLVVRAARLLQQNHSGPRRGVRIVLQKRIPVGAGLGGGSSNAAITLLVLNQLWGCGFPRPRLQALAGELGSDVPFFLEGGMALARGRGEGLAPLPDLQDPLSVQIFYPGVSHSTAEAYRRAEFPLLETEGQLTRGQPDTKIWRFHEVLKSGEWGALENDFERSVFAHHPRLAEFKTQLERTVRGRVMLCGSGSALMAVSFGGDLPDLTKSPSAECIEAFSCRTLTRREYASILNNSGLNFN